MTRNIKGLRNSVIISGIVLAAVIAAAVFSHSFIWIGLAPIMAVILANSLGLRAGYLRVSGWPICSNGLKVSYDRQDTLPQESEINPRLFLQADMVQDVAYFLKNRRWRAVLKWRV